MKAKVRRGIGLVAHDAMKKDLIEWVLWNSELLMGNKFYCTGTTGTLILEALKEKHPDEEWDFTILKSGPLGGDQQMGSRIVDGQIDYLFFFTDPMTLQPHDTDVKALTRLAGVENIVFCCNRSTADHIISSPLFMDPDYERIHPDYASYTKRFQDKPVVTEAVESVNRRKKKRKDWRCWKRKNFHPIHFKNRRHISNARVWRWNTKICPRFCMRQRSYINFFQMPLSRNTRVEQKTMAIVMHTTFPPIFQNEGMQIRSIP